MLEISFSTQLHHTHRIQCNFAQFGIARHRLMVGAMAG